MLYSSYSSYLCLYFKDAKMAVKKKELKRLRLCGTAVKLSHKMVQMLKM